ncbi:CCL3 protein, partial [Pheucticus melanocephalus]|nr:CCL3 protein [Pheucticus melanocephalus]
WRGQRPCWALTRAMCVSPVLTDGVPSTCCFTYQRQPIPRRRVSSVFNTSSSCSQPGVIVVTLKKKQLCADPRDKWVQELQKHFQSQGN